jgi:ATP-dependent DNA helicase PIF1
MASFPTYKFCFILKENRMSKLVVLKREDIPSLMEETVIDTSCLSPEQQLAYDKFVKGENIFVTGPGGTGKSYTINEIYTKSSKKVALTALTGCAALLIHPQAKTLHSWAGIGLGKDPLPKMVAIVRKSRKAMIRWISTEVLVIDEISMMTPELFENLKTIELEEKKWQH